MRVEGSHWLFPLPDHSSPRENVPLETTRGLDSSVSRNHPPPSVFNGTICNLAGSHWLSLPVEGRQRLVTSLPKLNLSFLDECRTGALGDKTVLHSKANHVYKLNATSTANEVSTGTEVASWYIASGNEMRDDALSRPLLGTHWLLAEGCDDKQKQQKTVAAVFHTGPELRGSTPAYTRARPSSAVKPHKFTRARPSSAPWDRHENKEKTVAANAEYRELIARFHRHQQQGGRKTGVMKD